MFGARQAEDPLAALPRGKNAKEFVKVRVSPSVTLWLCLGAIWGFLLLQKVLCSGRKFAPPCPASVVVEYNNAFVFPALTQVP